MYPGRPMPWRLPAIPACFSVRGRPRGVTLAELITLLVVLAVLVAVAVPGISPVLLHYRLRWATWQLGVTAG